MATNNRTLSMLNIVNLRSSIDKLMVSESASIAITTLCKDYKAKLDEGAHDEELCESFAIELEKVANTETAKSVLKSLTESIEANKQNIELAKSVYKLYSGSTKYVAPVLESAVVNYMINKNAETRSDLLVSASLFENNKAVKEIVEAVNYEAFVEKEGRSLVNAELKDGSAVNEEAKEKVYTQAEVDAIIAGAKNESVATKKTVGNIENHINLHGVITRILESNGNNEKLRIFCNKYIQAMNEGKKDELLYESFISGLSNWNYLSAVDTELSALKDRVSKYKQDVDIKKILETMSETDSYFIVPLIEDVIVEYLENKSMTTRRLAIQRLESFEYDNFVRDIINIIQGDRSVKNSVYLGESVETPNDYVRTEEVYSPIEYINENETVFNVNGFYYKRSGNNVSKLGKNDVAALSESFKSLCALVNSSSVKISGATNTISVYNNDNVAKINESEINVDGKKVSEKELVKLVETAKYMGNNELAGFYTAVKILNENFDSIASVDFVKHLVANDGSGRSVDVFKIGNSISVHTVNESIKHYTYYKNVNPIQCQKYINEHMGIKVSNIFEDVLPEQENVKKGIDEKKAEYEAFIQSLEEKKETLLKMKEEGDADTKDIDDAIAMIDKELDDTKSDYKKYQDDAEKYLNGDDKDKEDSLDGEAPKDDDVDKDDKDGGDGEEPKDGEGDDDSKADAGEEGGDDKPAESPEDMEQPIGDVTMGGAPSEEPEPDEFADVPEFDADFDIAIDATDTPAEGEGAPAVEAPATEEGENSYKVVRVSYNKNVKTGEVSNKGEVVIIIPSVDADGNVHDDMRKVTFYLDSERTPVINNEYMPLDMYMAIKSAIEACSDTETVPTENPEGPTDGGSTPVPPVTPEPSQDGGEPVPPVESTPASPAAPAAQAPVAEPVTPEPPKEASAEAPTAETEAPVPPVEQETPAEVEKKDDEVTYPVTVDVLPNEIEPIDVKDFEESLDTMKIEHCASEANDGAVVMKLGNKAQVYKLKDYFKDWLNYSEDEFKAFFPELANCFNKKDTYPVAATNEGVSVKKVSKAADGKSFNIGLPMTKELCEAVGMKYDEKANFVTLIAENAQEARTIYNRLYEYSEKKGDATEQDVKDILERYEPVYGTPKSYKLTVPYNGFLESKLAGNGIEVSVVNENMTAEIKKDGFNKAKKILESFYGDAAPVEARDFYQFLNEAVTITVKDDSTGKTVTINTDELNGKTEGAASDVESPDFDKSFDNTTTFKYEDSMVFKDGEDSADEDKDKEKKEGEDKEDDKSKNEGEDGVALNTEGSDSEGEGEDKEKDKEGEGESSEEGEKSEDGEKPKKKFKFKASKKSNESVEEGAAQHLNESANATVLDMVDTPDGKGQIICELADGTVIVNVMGHTFPYSKNQVKLLKEKSDTVQFPWKIDPVTLKAIFESYVNCGMFMNDIQLTPGDCKVKLLEYNKANDDQEIELVIEGERTKALKKYIRITENLKETFDLANYGEGKLSFINESGMQTKDVLINLNDYRTYKSLNQEAYPVRIIMQEGEEAHMSYVNGTNVVLNESGDVYEPEYAASLMEAMKIVK